MKNFLLFVASLFTKPSSNSLPPDKMEIPLDGYIVNGINYQYQHFLEGGRKEVFSGMYDHAKWLLIDDICDILKDEGFKKIEVKEDREERNGPRLLLFASR